MGKHLDLLIIPLIFVFKNKVHKYLNKLKYAIRITKTRI